MHRRIVLASTSPRRIEILKKAISQFEVVAPEYKEDMGLPMPPIELVKHLAEMKARSVAHRFPDALIIGADTFIVLEDKIYGKPGTPKRATEMLRELSGKMHLVLTGFAVLDTKDKKITTGVDTVKVYVKSLTEEQISEYVATGEPLDKAAAYAIQSDGKSFIEKFEGDYFTILGLPLTKVVNILTDWQAL